VGGQHRLRILDPVRHRPVGELATGFAMAGIVEADEGAPDALGPGGERFGLGGAHVRAQAAKPDHRRALAGQRQHRDLAALAAGPDAQKLRAQASSLYSLL
jgi:hypothetical protein